MNLMNFVINAAIDGVAQNKSAEVYKTIVIIGLSLGLPAFGIGFLCMVVGQGKLGKQIIFWAVIGIIGLGLTGVIIDTIRQWSGL